MALPLDSPRYGSTYSAFLVFWWMPSLRGLQSLVVRMPHSVFQLVASSWLFARMAM